jgi:hypothetical protein
MLSGKYISLKEIIDNLLRDRGYKYELSYSDCIEWSVEAMRLIGAPSALVNKQSIIELSGNRAELPIDFSEMIQLAGSFGGSYPFAMSTSTGSFTSQKIQAPFQITQDLLSGTNINLIEETPIGQDINGNPVYAVQEHSIIFPKGIAQKTSLDFFTTSTYSINNNYIFTNFEVGFLFLSYRAIPIDCDGLPMIPDNQRYIEAVKTFIGMKLDYLLWRRGELSERIYRDSESEWMWYVGSAGNAARMPNYDGMQSLMNQIKLLGNKYSHNKFFNNLGK